MAETPATTEMTEAPHKSGGFPPFDTSTFPSQIFWLVVTFALLFTVLWRVAGPRINNVIATRRSAINGAITEANRARAEAEAAQAKYEMALTKARTNASILAEETRQKLNAEIAKAKAEADTKAHEAMAAADARIAGTRESAKAAVTAAARDAAIAIVERLTGDKVSAEEAAKVVGS